MEGPGMTKPAAAVFTVSLSLSGKVLDSYNFTDEDLKQQNGGLDWLREALVREADITMGKMR